MAYKLGSLFDGSGGFPLAGSLCGIVPVWAAEVEPYPIAVTRSRFPDMCHLGDISKVNGAEIEPVDIITFGSPCQDLSVAGKRAGLKHADNGDEETTRSGLFMEAIRIIKEMRAATNGVYPRIALWENVPGAFSSNKGEDFRTVLQELIQIIEPAAVMPAVPKNGWPYADSYCGDGWSLAYRVFDTQYWPRTPQRRRRIHLVVDFAGQCAQNVLFERKGLRGNFEAGGTPWQAAAANAERGTGAADAEGAVPYTLKIRSGCEGGGKGALVQENQNATLATHNDQYLFQPMSCKEENWAECIVRNALRAGESKVSHCIVQRTVNANILDDQGGQQINVRTDGKSPTLRAEMHGNVPFVLQVYRKGARPHSKDEAQTWEEAQVANTLNTFDRGEARANELIVMASGQAKAETSKDFCPTINCNHEQPIVVNGMDCRNGRLNGDICGTLQAKPNGGFSYNCTHPVLIETPIRYIVRRLTETECARLQGFADNWGEIDEKDELPAEEFSFWLEVRNTHAAINGKAAKEYTKKQMLAWYNKLHTPTAEYKMWGNGIALPPALYCMQGIMDAFKKEEENK